MRKETKHHKKKFDFWDLTFWQSIQGLIMIFLLLILVDGFGIGRNLLEALGIEYPMDWAFVGTGFFAYPLFRSVFKRQRSTQQLKVSPSSVAFSDMKNNGSQTKTALKFIFIGVLVRTIGLEFVSIQWLYEMLINTGTLIMFIGGTIIYNAFPEAYSPSAEPLRRHVIDTIKDPDRINLLYSKARYGRFGISEMSAWQAVLKAHKESVKPGKKG